MEKFDLQQSLMDEVYDKWRTEECSKMDKLEVIDKYFTPKHKIAVQLGNMNYQVNNGGWSQWHFNGFDEDLEDLIQYAKMGTKLNLKTFTTLLQILTDIKALGEPSDYDDTEWNECPECSGSGIIYTYDDEDNEIEKECSECGGEGKWEEDIDGEQAYCEMLEEFDDKFYKLDENIFLNDCEKLIENFKSLTDEDISNVEFKTTIKPRCKLIGEDGNVFNIIGKVGRTLKDSGLENKFNDFKDKAFKSHSYDEVLRLCMDYVDVF